MSKFFPLSYGNDIGQTLNPGDKVVAITSGYANSLYVNPGIYRGIYLNEDMTVFAIKVDIEPKYEWKRHNGVLRSKRAYAIV